MHDWDSLAALGNYLGMADAGRLADGRAGRPRSGQDAGIDQQQCPAPRRKFVPPGVAGDLPEVLASTDFASLAQQEGDRLGVLSNNLYKRLALPPYSHGDLPAPDLRYAGQKIPAPTGSFAPGSPVRDGHRKEIVSLENPAVRESVEEIRRLPCRAYGGMISPVRHGHFSASLAQYVQTLLDRPGIGVRPAGRIAILDILDRLPRTPTTTGWSTESAKRRRHRRWSSDHVLIKERRSRSSSRRGSSRSTSPSSTSRRPTSTASAPSASRSASRRPRRSPRSSSSPS